MALLSTAHWRVVPGSPIEKLPRPLRPIGVVARNYMVKRKYVLVADDMATAHYCPFIDDAEFEALYWEMQRSWYPGADIRWRMWLLTTLAQSCQHLDGNFAEFGTWRGGSAYMVLGRTKVPAAHRFFLFDTFTGIPSDRLTERERKDGFGGRLNDTSLEHVDNLLAPWRTRYVLCPGDIFETLNSADVGRLSFAHVDLNASAATRFSLDYAYKRMVCGGIIVFDDYGYSGYEDQRSIIDEFFHDLREQPIALPTGQAFIVKR
jgi:O-methyltransferase